MSKDVNRLLLDGQNNWDIFGDLRRLPKEFYSRHALQVGPELLGLLLIHENPNRPDRILAGIITEVEAYVGPHDRACHGYGMSKTNRNKAMYGRPGTAYVFFIYGMHYCFNIAVFKEGLPYAILVRSVEPILGKDIMLKRRNGKYPLASGPGRLCQAMGITKNHDGADLVTGSLYLAKPSKPCVSTAGLKIVKTPRIGIDYSGPARDYPWRFMLHPKELTR